jgi:hypothetical protein
VSREQFTGAIGNPRNVFFRISVASGKAGQFIPLALPGTRIARHNDKGLR